MTNDNDLLLLASSQNNGTYRVYIDSSGKKTLTPQTSNYTATYIDPKVYYNFYGTDENVSGLLADKNPEKVIFPNCEVISSEPKARSAFFENFYNCTSLTSVSFPVLTSITVQHTFLHAFRGCTALTSVSFPVLTSVTNFSFSSAFEDCTSLTSVSFPSLITIKGDSFSAAFRGCTALTSVSFPSLTSGYEDSIFAGAFANCTSLTSVSFPVLKIVYTNSFSAAFSGCTALTSVSFPSLTSIWSSTDYRASFLNAFKNCHSSLKVHFKKSMEGKTGLDYKTMGLIRADQVVFDLP